MSCPEPAADGGGETSTDAFYAGAFHLLQPKGRGFRAGLDALLLAAAVPADAAGRAADLGAGAGAASLAVAVRAPALHVTLVEKDPGMAALARGSLALPANAALAPRLAVIEADLLARRPEREAAGLAEASFDLVLSNPPFHPAGGRLSPDAGRSAARAMPAPGFLLRWITAAGALLRDGGLLVLVARPDNLGEILAAAENRFGALAIRPVETRAGAPASRILLRARRGSRAPLSLLSPLVLNDADGRATTLSHEVAAGRAAIGF